MKTGIKVYCKLCGRSKAPHGRSCLLVDSLCTSACRGYNDDPKPGCLWPGETAEDFGFFSCDHATEER